MKFPFKRFPGKTFEPKVQMEKEAEPKHIVLKVERERRRRLYQSKKLQDILAEKGINTSDLLRKTYLPLEIFDDEDYDCRYCDYIFWYTCVFVMKNSKFIINF